MGTTNELIQMQQDVLRLVETLHEIATTSNEAETVRHAMSALTGTQAGLNFLVAQPLRM